MALWSTQQLLATIRGPDGQREVLVPRPFARVGAHPDSEVVLDSPQVAKRALYLHAMDDGLFCLDLDVEDAVLEKRGRWLTPDDLLTIGPYQISFRLAGDAPIPALPPPSPVAWGSASAPLPVLNVHCRRLLKDKRRFRARLNIIGRRPQCALQLRGSHVSYFHCVLYWEQRRLWCVDLLSSNGTQLNGETIDCTEVQLNDRLDVGEFGLVYHRWSPRRSMQPGWLPPPAGDSAEHESLESDDSAPVLDAAAPPSAADADMALAADLSDSDGSDIELSDRDVAATQCTPVVGHAARLDPQLAEHWQHERAQLTAERTALEARLAERSAELVAASAQLKSLREAAANQEQMWREDRQSLTGQLAERAQQLSRLQAETAASAAAVAERQAREAALSRDKAAAEAAAVRQQVEINRLSAALAAVEARTTERTQPVMSPVDTTARQRFAAEAARLAQERDELRAQWSESSQRFADQIEQANAETTRLAGELSAAMAAQDAELAARQQLQAEAQFAAELIAKLEAQLAQQEAHLAHLAQERQDLQTQWSAAQQQLATQAERAREHATRAAELRAAGEARERHWQAERRSLSEQLAGRSTSLAVMEAELTAARDDLSRRRQELDHLRAQVNDVPSELPTEERVVAESTSLRVAMTPSADAAAADLSSAMQETDGERFADWPTAVQTLPAEQMQPAEQLQPPEPAAAQAKWPAIDAADPPVSRRSKASRHEMVDFIGDRLIELESRQKRRNMVVWSAVAASALVLSGLILGVWYLLR